MSKIIIKQNSVVFNYETKESSFFECENRELENEFDYRFVIDYLKNYGANGIDIIIGVNEIGYIKYTTHTPFDCGCGFDIVKYTDDAHEKVEIFACGCCVKRYCEKARNIMAAELRDIVKELQDSTDWVIDFAFVEEAAMGELNNAIETAENTIKSAEEKIDREIKCGSIDGDIIGNAAQDVFDTLVSVKVAVHDFLKKMSDYTNCDFIMEDAYGELFFETDKMYFDLLDDIDVEGEFMNWLMSVLKTCTDGECMANTLYHYIAVA